MYTLHYSPGACSMAVHTALLECGQNVTLEKVDLSAWHTRSPEFLKINPRGQVPVLLDGAQVIREGAAQLIHILEKHKNALLPSSEPERTVALEWLMFANATLHPAYSRVFFLKKNLGDEAVTHPLMKTAVAMIQKLWDEVEGRLAAHPYLAGQHATIADILVTVIANWSNKVPHPIKLGPKSKQMFQSIIARPAFQKALQAEGVEYQAAA